MNKFIENFNEFLNHYKIKQSILAKKIKYDPNKLSRLLKGKQKNVSIDDMMILATAVGKDINYFIKEMSFQSINDTYESEIAFSSGTPTKESEEFANILFDFIEHVDFIMGMENKINQNLKEVLINEI